MLRVCFRQRGRQRCSRNGNYLLWLIQIALVKGFLNQCGFYKNILKVRESNDVGGWGNNVVDSHSHAAAAAAAALSLMSHSHIFP